MERKKRIVPIILIFLVFIIFGCIAYMKSLLDQIEHDTITVSAAESGATKSGVQIAEPGQEPVTNLALFGIDSEAGDNGRSDTILILYLDRTKNALKLASVMRDSYVDIDGRGMDKINHSYAFGGPQLAMKTLNENFDLSCTKYVALNFSDFVSVIDKLGGIEITVTDEEAREVPGLETGGTYNLTGDQALAFSRIRRLAGGDYERTFRQRILIEKIYETLSARTLLQNVTVAGDILPAVKTNLTDSEIISLCAYIAANRPELFHNRFPQDDDCKGEKIKGVYYLVFDREKTADAMHAFLFGQ